jgi:hypothetical protein
VIRHIKRSGWEISGTPDGDSSSLFSGRNLSSGTAFAYSIGFSNLSSYMHSKDQEYRIAELKPLLTEASDSLNVLVENKTSEEKNRTDAEKKLQTSKELLDMASTESEREMKREEYQKARVSMEKAEKALKDAQQALMERKSKIDRYKGDQSVIDLLTNGTSDPNAPIARKARKHLVKSGPGDMNHDQIDLQIGYTKSSFPIFDPTGTTLKNQIQPTDSQGLSAILSYSAEYIDVPRVLGIAVGIQRRNNSEDLRKITLQDTSFNFTEGSTRREGIRTKSALIGPLETFTATVVNTDFVVLPREFKSRLGINLFTRNTIVSRNWNTRYGLGVFLTQNGVPRKIIGGVSVTNGDKRQANVNLFAGYNF